MREAAARRPAHRLRVVIAFSRGDKAGPVKSSVALPVSRRRVSIVRLASRTASAVHNRLFGFAS
jgi:hypothetical protein